jgi:N-succinyldiaminopimelate aminotransferase
MNPGIAHLHRYPFDRLAELLAGLSPPAGRPLVDLSLGEPRHPTPAVVREALVAGLDGLSHYPATAGGASLREGIADWLTARYRLPPGAVDPKTQVLPVNGTREALFALAQCLVAGDGVSDADGNGGAVVAMPNPFYQIYEGAALLAGATPWYLPCTAEDGFLPRLDEVPEMVWARTRLLYLCSPGNPHGACLTLAHWRECFALMDAHGFAVAADECYSEIYPDEAAPPLGVLEAAWALGRRDFRGIVAFHSLSKRSNCPGLRSGAVAGDAALLAPFLLYRTYHGSAMPPHHQAASLAAWRDEGHVRENRARYRAKFAQAAELLAGVAGLPPVSQPAGGFYLWLPAPGGDDLAWTRRLLAEQGVRVLPGSFLAREHEGVNPGAGYLRLALVATEAECATALARVATALAAG